MLMALMHVVGAGLQLGNLAFFSCCRGAKRLFIYFIDFSRLFNPDLEYFAEHVLPYQSWQPWIP